MLADLLVIGLPVGLVIEMVICRMKWTSLPAVTTHVAGTLPTLDCVGMTV